MGGKEVEIYEEALPLSCFSGVVSYFLARVVRETVLLAIMTTWELVEAYP